jgi:hypothetical protein
MKKPNRTAFDGSLERRLRTLESKKARLVEQLETEIATLCHLIRERWRHMPLDTLHEAKKAYVQRLLDIDLDKTYARSSLDRELDCTVSLHDPARVGTPEIKSHYNAASDVEWYYTDAGDHWESDMRWMVGITNVSQYSAIRKFQRRQLLERTASAA